MESPFAKYFQTPEWIKPIAHVLYTPTRYLEEKMNRPEDQCVYMISSCVALLCCFLLKAHPGSAFQRKLFSTTCGLFINYYVFGMSGLASLVTNVISYVLIRVMPSKYSHIVVIVVSGLALAQAQIHK